VILNEGDIKRSCSIEANVNIQPFVLLLYTTVNMNVHMQIHDFQSTSTVHQSVTRCHAVNTAKADCEWPGIQRISTGRSNQGTVEIREV